MSRHVGFVHTFSREGVNQAAYGGGGGVEAALLLQAGFQSGQGALGGVGAAVGGVGLARQAVGAGLFLVCAALGLLGTLLQGARRALGLVGLAARSLHLDLCLRGYRCIAAEGKQDGLPALLGQIRSAYLGIELGALLAAVAFCLDSGVLPMG